MPIFNTYERGWDYVKNESKKLQIGLKPTSQFWKDIKIKKSRSGFKCISCEKQQPFGGCS